MCRVDTVPPCVTPPSLCVCALISPFKGTVTWMRGPHYTTSFYLHHLFKDPLSEFSHVLRS